jgi:hypothetical protein
MTSPEPNTDLAMALLIGLDSAGRHDLFAIHPTLPEKAPGKTEAATFLPHQRDEMRAWIDQQQGKRNVYTSVNRARDDAPKNVRLKKEHIRHIRAIVADIDAKKVDVHGSGDPSGENFRMERARLENVALELADGPICPPTVIVDSGGGLQPWWQLLPMMPTTPKNVALAEGIGRTLAYTYGGDSVFDVARIMRLPGTINIPTVDKAAQGRAAALATVLTEESSGETYTLERLAAWAPPTPEKASANDRPKSPIDWDAVEADSYEELPAALRAKFEAYGKSHPAVAKLWEGTPAPWQKGLSASEFEFALAWALKRSGNFTATEFAQLHAVWDQRSVKHAGDQRTVQRAWDNNPDGTSGFVAEDIAPRQKATALAGAAEQTEWGEPTDLWSARFEPVDLPAGVVPQAIECVARDQAKRLGVEPGACAAALVTVMGSLVPAGNQMQMRQRDPDWRVKPILWTALIGDPGSNKSAIVEYATRAATSLETKWAKEYAADRHEYDRTISSKQKAAKSAKDPAAKAETAEPPLSNSPKDWLDVARAPTLRRKVVRDATTEKLCEILSENPDGLLFSADELTGLFGGMDAYRIKGGKDRPLWLQAKDGGPYTVDRKSHDTLRVDNLAISILGGIQPSMIKMLGSGLAKDGMLQRFLPIMVRRHGIGEDVAANKTYAEVLERAAALIVQSEPSTVLRFTPEGDRERLRLEDFQQVEIKRHGVSPAMRQWLDKMPNEFGRLALIFHFIEWHTSPEGVLSASNPPPLVSADTARRARRFLTEFAFPHALVFHQSVLGRSEYEEHAAWIGGYILARGLSVVSLRDIYKNYSPFKPAKARGDLPGIMQALESEDWLCPCSMRQQAGRPTRWFVNPAVHEAFTAQAATERDARASAQTSIREEGARRSVEAEPESEASGYPPVGAKVSPTVSELLA